MPSVAMKGGTFILAMTKPLTRPQAPPASRPTTTPSGTGSPRSTMNTPVMTAEKVSTVPIERSMPPVMMTKVTPNASTPLTAVDRRMATMLSSLRK